MAIITREVLFSDISFYQGIINWDTMKTKSPAAIIRAGQNLWVDPQFKRNYSEAKRVGMKRGIYWFYDSRVHPDTQADILIDLIKDDLPEMEVFCDYERSYGGSYVSLPWAVRFMKRLETYLPNVKVGMYTGYYFFKDNTSPTLNAEQYAYLKDRPLWLAWYTTSPSTVIIPAPWNKVTHWQWTSSGDGRGWGTESNGLDLNYYNGTIQEFNQKYGGITTPPTNGGSMTEIVYSNGVKVITGRLNDSDYRTMIIPYASVSSMTYVYNPSKCIYVENVPGYDFVANFVSFTQCKPNLGLRIGGTQHEPYHNYNPYLALDGVPKITHVYKDFSSFKTVSQAFRYIIENSVKNPKANADWNIINPLRLAGTKPNGDLVITMVKGRESGVQRGWNLHEAATYGLSLGCNMMVDADGGSSVQETLTVDGLKSLHMGIPINQRGAVPVFLAIKFKTPLTTTTPPPPPPVDGWPEYFHLEKPDGTRARYNKE